MLTRQHFLRYLAISAGALAIGARAQLRAAEAGGPFPLQLEVRTPFAPAVFPSAGGAYVVYELYLTNFSAGSMTLRRIEVNDADRATPIARFENDALRAIVQPVGGPVLKEGPIQLGPGATSIVYIWLAFENMQSVPGRLDHQVLTADNSVASAAVGTRQIALPLLAPPVRGAGWMASDGPSNSRDNHHRRGLLALDGRMVISRRFAIDWFLHRSGASRAGDMSDPNSHHAYEEPVFAVADATVLIARDGQPDNIPGPVGSFRPAVPITMDTVAGNQIMLDLGNGRYAWYFHLRQGSVRVKPGNRVRRGEALAQIGCSGDANLPHLHFEVTTSPKLLAGEGVPYLIDHYRVWTAENVWQPRSRELPLDRMLVDFGQA